MPGPNSLKSLNPSFHDIVAPVETGVETDEGRHQRSRARGGLPQHLVSAVTTAPETELNCPTVYENNYLHLQRQDFAFHIKVSCWD